jgi:hypothetical protein
VQDQPGGGIHAVLSGLARPENAERLLALRAGGDLEARAGVGGTPTRTSTAMNMRSSPSRSCEPTRTQSPGCPRPGPREPDLDEKLRRTTRGLTRQEPGLRLTLENPCASVRLSTLPFGSDSRQNVPLTKATASASGSCASTAATVRSITSSRERRRSGQWRGSRRPYGGSACGFFANRASAPRGHGVGSQKMAMMGYSNWLGGSG